MGSVTPPPILVKVTFFDNSLYTQEIRLVVVPSSGLITPQRFVFTPDHIL